MLVYQNVDPTQKKMISFLNPRNRFSGKDKVSQDKSAKPFLNLDAEISNHTPVVE